jgi:hypothetical protein
MIDSMRPWDETEDPLPSEAFMKIAGLLNGMPRTFEQGTRNAHMTSVQTTLEFPVVGPEAQDEALSRVLHAAMLTEALFRNLLHEKGLL